MKVRFDVLCRVRLFVLLVLLCWGFPSGAQTLTNTNAPATNAPSALLRKVERMEGHPLTFGLDRLNVLRENDFLGEPLWKYAASLIYVALAFVVAWLLHRATEIWLRRVVARSATRIDDILLELLQGPIRVVAFVLLLNVGLNFFEWSGAAKLYFSKALVLVVAISLTYLAVKVVDLLLKVWRQRSAQEENRKT